MQELMVLLVPGFGRVGCLEMERPISRSGVTFELRAG